MKPTDHTNRKNKRVCVCVTALLQTASATIRSTHSKLSYEAAKFEVISLFCLLFLIYLLINVRILLLCVAEKTGEEVRNGNSVVQLLLGFVVWAMCRKIGFSVLLFKKCIRFDWISISLVSAIYLYVLSSWLLKPKKIETLILLLLVRKEYSSDSAVNKALWWWYLCRGNSRNGYVKFGMLLLIAYSPKLHIWKDKFLFIWGI